MAVIAFPRSDDDDDPDGAGAEAPAAAASGPAAPATEARDDTPAVDEDAPAATGVEPTDEAETAVSDVPVWEPPPVPTVVARDGDLRPVVPAWMTTAASRRAALRWYTRLAWHWYQFHFYRAPRYAVVASYRL